MVPYPTVPYPTCTHFQAIDSFLDVFKEMSSNIERVSTRLHHDLIYNPEPEKGKMWMPISIVTPEKRRGEIIGKWTHALLVIWKVEGDILMFPGEMLQSSRMAVNKVAKKFPQYIHPKTAILTLLTAHYNNFPADLMVGEIPKAPLEAITPYETEAIGQDILLKLLSNEQYCRTNEGCLADGVYAPYAEWFNVLPIQLKTCRKVVNKGHFSFWLGKSYSGLLVIAMALTLNIIIVIPGADLPEKTLGGAPTGKYKKYLVKPDQLAHLLSQLYINLINGVSHQIWPSGEEIRIDSIKLTDRTTAMIPLSLMQQKEHSAMLNRMNKLPNLTYLRPAVENGTIDWYVESIGIQDKNARASGKIFVAALTRVTKEGCYKMGDFEALWLHLGTSDFYIIPAIELSKRGFFYENPESKGKKGISVCPNECVKNKDMWANAYKFSYESPDIEEQVKRHLQNIKRVAYL